MILNWNDGGAAELRRFADQMREPAVMAKAMRVWARRRKLGVQ